MKRITHTSRPRDGVKTLHIETDGAVINIRAGLEDNQGRKVTAISISPDDETRSPDLDGYYWDRVGDRIIRRPEPGTSTPHPGPSLSAEEIVALISDDHLHSVLGMIEDKIEAATRDTFPQQVAEGLESSTELREYVAQAGHGAAVKLMWRTDWYDNGYFFEGATTLVEFADGSREQFDINFDETLTEVRGTLDREPQSRDVLVFDIAAGTYTVSHEALLDL